MFNNILITQRELSSIGGSELVTLELSEYFLSQRAKNIFIYTSYYDKPMQTLFKKEKNIKVLTDFNNIDLELMDLIWIHHQFIPYNLFDLYNKKKIKAKIVFNHMSFYTPLELPLYYHLENKLADLILYNSLETKQNITKDFKIKPKGMILANPAPDSFMVNTKDIKKSTQLKTIRIISNRDYPQKESMMNMLRKKGYIVEQFGISGSTYKRITKADILAADLIISIGKTVQYCLLAQKPVYVYDRFGGPGYLNKSNFIKSSQYNFSGRGFKEKSDQILLNDIINGFNVSQANISSLHKRYAQKYSLSENMKILYKKLNQEKKHQSISSSEILSYSHGYDMSVQARKAYLDLDKEHKGLAKSYHKTINKLDKEYKSLAKSHHKTVNEIEQLREDNNNLLQIINKRNQGIIGILKRKIRAVIVLSKNIIGKNP